MKTIWDHYPELLPQKEAIEAAIEVLASSYERGGKYLIAGNGGSSADSSHIVGELMKGFMKKRVVDGFPGIQDGIPCIDLTAQQSLLSAFANDVDPTLVYAQQVYVYGKNSPEDVLIVLSTSGNSKNAVKAAEVAKRLGLKVIAFTGSKPSQLSAIADVTIQAPSEETYRIQEYHLPIYHHICQRLEDRFFE